MVLRQPDLGTALLILIGGLTVMFIAGVSWIYFLISGLGVFTFVFSIFHFRGTEFQILKNYQYRRIDTFLDPANDPLGAGYHITQVKNCSWIWRVFWKRFYARNTESLKLFTRKAY